MEDELCELMNEADFLCKFCFEAYASQMWEQEQRHTCKLLVMAPTKGEQNVGWGVVSGHVLARALTDPSIQRGLAVLGSDLVSSTLLFFCTWHVVYRAGCFAEIKH